MKIKLCGFKEPSSLQTAIDFGCDFIGCVFVENSPRNINLDDAKKLSILVPTDVARVAVILERQLDEVKEIVEYFQPQYLQIHHFSNLEYIEKIKKIFPEIKIILAFALNNNEDLKQINPYNHLADFWLFDNKNPGSGKVFNWQLIEHDLITKPWFLSGGINIHNIDEAINKTHAQYIDISSGIEFEKGVKSSSLIKEILQKIKNYH